MIINLDDCEKWSIEVNNHPVRAIDYPHEFIGSLPINSRITITVHADVIRKLGLEPDRVKGWDQDFEFMFPDKSRWFRRYDKDYKIESFTYDPYNQFMTMIFFHHIADEGTVTRQLWDEYYSKLDGTQ